MSTQIARAHVVVSGRVQGVFYRAETTAQARRRCLAGWVRNLPDGDVEAVFEGSKEAVDSLVEWCRRGPQGARVAALETSWEEPIGEVGFRIIG